MAISLGELAVRYGCELAECVSEHLQSGNALVYNHRDYCGMGLCYVNGRFIYGSVMDGCVDDEMSWWTKEAFIAWLAEQTDSALLGDGNQRVHRRRLLEWLPESSAHAAAQRP